MAGKTITFNRYVDGDIGDKPISRLKHNNVTYEIADEQAREDIVTKQDIISDLGKIRSGSNSFYVKGTQTASTPSFTGVLSAVDELYEGLTIDYWLPFAGTSTAATLNLTLAGGATTGPINCYYSSTTRLTTHLAANCVGRLIYQTVTISGTSYTGWWLLKAYYTDGNTYDRTYDNYYRAYAGAAIPTYALLMKGANGRLYPMVSSYGTATTKVVTTVGLRPDFIWWYNGNATVNAGAVIKAQSLYRVAPSQAGSSFFNSSLPTYCDIYLCGNYDENTDLFYLATTNASGTASTTDFYRFVPYNTEPTYSDYFIEGRYYIFLGSSYSSANYFQLMNQHPLYYYDGANLIKINKKITDSAIITHDSSNSAHSTLFNNKQDKLTTQTAYSAKGNATKVPQITTNNLGQVTGITEVTISQPTVNNKTITIQKNSTAVDSFTLNQSTDKTINISVPTTAADVGAVPTTRTVNGKALSSDISLTASDVGAISSHQSIKSLKTDNTTAQTTSSSEAIAGSGTINLHKVSKTGSYSDLLNKPTIPATNVIPATTTANKVLVSTTTSGTAKWSDFSSAGFLKTNSSGVISVDTNSYYLSSNPSGYTSNAGTVTSVRVQATSPVQSSTSSAQSTSLNTTISLADAYGDTKNPYGTKTANYVLAGPTSGSAAAPSFRALVIADLPSIGSDKVSSMTSYSKPSTTSAITTSDTLNQAIGKLEFGLDSKQNTISDLGYIRNQVAKVDDKIGSQDITDSGDSLPSAANYSVNDTFLNKTDKKLYKVEAPAYALDTGVSNNNVSINLMTGLATFDNSSDILSRSTTFEWSGTGVVINVHFKLNSISDGVIISNSCSKYSGQSRHSLDVILITSNDSNYLSFEYWTYGSGNKSYIFNYQLFDTVLQTDTDYYLYMVKNGDTCISTLSLNGYNNNIIETSEIPTQDVTGFQGWSPELKYGCNSWLYSSSNSGMSVYLLDSIGNFLVADGALTWDSGTALEDNTQYNDTTNEKTIYYNNDIIYEGGSVAVDSSTITLNSSNQIQTVGYKDVRTSNTLKTWTGTRAQYDAIVTKDANTLYNITDDTDVTATMLNLLYPVGAVYIGTMDVCPLASLGIGSWEKIAEDQVLQGSSLNHNAGTTISAGLPNITGNYWDVAGRDSNESGAIKYVNSEEKAGLGSGSSIGYGTVYLDASKANSIYGNSNTVQPPAFIVNIWRRIS